MSGDAVTTTDLGAITTKTGSLVIADFGLAHLFDPQADTARVAASREHGDHHAFQFQGVSAVTVHQVPTDVEVRVTGARMAERQDAWAHVDVHLRPADEGADWEHIGDVLVDCARLMVSDVIVTCAMGGGGTADGMSDLVWWGADAAEVARLAGVEPLKPGGGEYGFEDRIDEAVQPWIDWLDIVKQAGLRFAYDYRPHNYQWMILKEIRASPHDVGTVELETGGRGLGFFSALGDGIFGVHVRRDTDGAITTIRIDLAGTLAAGDDAGDPMILPDQPVSRLSDYAAMMVQMQAGDMNGALDARGLDLASYGPLAAAWSQALTADPELMKRYVALMSE